MKPPLFLIPLALASLACLGTAITQTPAPTAASAFTISDTEEPASGAVFEISTPPPALQCARVTAIQALHVRSEPNAESIVAGWLPNGQPVRVLQSGDWSLIQTDRLTGYVNSLYLTESECE